MLQDIRFAVRLFTKNLGFTAVAIATLGLAIAANTVVFSIVNAILIRPLPFAEPDRLVQINTAFLGQPGSWSFSAQEYFDLAREAHAFESTGAWVTHDANLTGGDRPVAVTTTFATAGLLPTLGVSPMLGRFFDPSEDVPGDGSLVPDGYGGTRVVVLGHGLFTSVFGGDRNIIGRTVRIDAIPTTVVGVMPPGFDFPEGTQAWVPAGIDMAKMRRGSHWYSAVGRLARGVDLHAARSELDGLMRAWSVTHRGDHAIDPVRHAITFRALQEDMVSPVRLALVTLQAAVVFVLLIACANISNLLLARAEARSSEIAVRVALGATRMRMARQFLTESLVLGLAGGAIGVLFAMWGLDLAVGLLPDEVPRVNEIRLDLTVLCYAVAVALITSLVFGLTPIFHSGGNLASTLRAAGQRTTSSRGRQFFRRVLIFAQVALAIVLVTGAGLMIRSFIRLQKTSLGFDPRGLVSLNLQLPKKAYPTDGDVFAFWTKVREGALRLPGVKSATLTSGLPPLRSRSSNSFEIVGRVQPADQKIHIDYWQYVGDEFLPTMGIHLVRGRVFDNGDREDGPKVVLINETMAKTFWPGEDPIGKRIRIMLAPPVGEAPEEQTIVGVVRDVKQGGVDAAFGTEVFIPMRQLATLRSWVPGETFMPRSMNLVLRADGDPRALLASIRTYITSCDAGLPIGHLQTMDRTVYDAIAKPRFVTTLLASFAGVALLMAAIGIYGVMSYSVEQRTRELSIRMALGADAGRLQRMLVFEGLELAAVGIVFGLVTAALMAFALEHWITSLLFDIGGLDPTTYAIVIVITGGAAALASYVPARRATRIHPMEAMRHE